MPALNHDNTKVVLITNGNFPDWGEEHCIKNVKANAEKLWRVLVDVIGVPEANIYSFSDQTASHIQEEFQEIVNNCYGKNSTLIVYYAGHGIPISKRGLFWATVDTKTTKNGLNYATAISTSEINKMLEDDCNAERKILIADCCYAAEFLEGKQSDVAGFIEKNVREIKGTFYMFSSNSDSESTFPLDKADEPTFFTQALVRSIYEGIDPTHEYCEMRQLYEKVIENINILKTEYNTLIPDPDKRIDGNAEHYILYKNPKYDEVEGDLDRLLANPNKVQIAKWITAHPVHRRTRDALKALTDYRSAEKEIENVRTLPVEEREDKLLELAAKYVDRGELVSMALARYLEEQGSSAKPVVESAKSQEPVFEGERQGRQASQQVPQLRSQDTTMNEDNKWTR